MPKAVLKPIGDAIDFLHASVTGASPRPYRRIAAAAP
jgi:hypothetical protein